VLRIKRDWAPIGAWLDALDARAPKNVVVVAMANKLARIAWAVLSTGEDYNPEPSLPQLKAVRKDACGLEAITRFHFTALRQRLEIYPPRSAQEQQGRKNSRHFSNLVTRMVSKEQPTDLEGRTRAQLIETMRTDLHKGRIHLRRLFSSSPFPLQPRGGPYILGTNSVGLGHNSFSMFPICPRGSPFGGHLMRKPFSSDRLTVSGQ
jgi:hypothetical protein